MQPYVVAAVVLFSHIVASSSIRQGTAAKAPQRPGNLFKHQYVPTPLPEDDGFPEDPVELHKEISIKLKRHPNLPATVVPTPVPPDPEDTREAKIDERDHKRTVKRLRKWAKVDQQITTRMAKAKKESNDIVHAAYVKSDKKEAAVKRKTREGIDKSERKKKVKDRQEKRYKEELKELKYEDAQERDVKKESEMTHKARMALAQGSASNFTIYQACRKGATVAQCERVMRRATKIQMMQDERMEKVDIFNRRLDERTNLKLQGIDPNTTMVPEDVQEREHNASHSGNRTEATLVSKLTKWYKEMASVVARAAGGSGSGLPLGWSHGLDPYMPTSGQYKHDVDFSHKYLDINDKRGSDSAQTAATASEREAAAERGTTTRARAAGSAGSGSGDGSGSGHVTAQEDGTDAVKQTNEALESRDGPDQQAQSDFERTQQEQNNAREKSESDEKSDKADNKLVKSDNKPGSSVFSVSDVRTLDRRDVTSVSV